MSTTQKQFNPGDECYTIDGQKVEFVAYHDGECIARTQFDYGDDYGYGPPETHNTLYADPPKAVYDADIQKQRDQFLKGSDEAKELRKQLQDLRSLVLRAENELESKKREHFEFRKGLGAYAELQLAAEILEGNVKYVVHEGHEFRCPRITDIKNWNYNEVIKMESFGGKLQWVREAGRESICLYRTLEEAKTDYASRINAWWKKAVNSGRDEYIEPSFTQARNMEVEIPAFITDYLQAKADKKAEFERLQAKLTGVTQ